MPATDIAADRVERLAARCVPGSGPVHVDRLGSGLVNRSYRVGRDGRDYSLRVAAPRASELGLDRAWECRVLHCAAAAGLAPAVERCEPRTGVLIARWAEGRCWSPEDASSPGVIEQIARLARRVHSLPRLVRPRIVSAAQWVAFYRGALGRRSGRSPGGRSEGRGRDPGRRNRGLSRLDGMAQSLLDALAGEPGAASALCHSDLHVQNLVIPAGGDPIILDWEYAHVSDPWWDLAGWACNGDLTAKRRDLLLGCYLGTAPRADETARLGRLAWLYDYVCLLWSEVYLMNSRSGKEGPGDTVSMRARRLAQRLRDGP